MKLIANKFSVDVAGTFFTLQGVASFSDNCLCVEGKYIYIQNLGIRKQGFEGKGKEKRRGMDVCLLPLGGKLRNVRTEKVRVVI